MARTYRRFRRFRRQQDVPASPVPRASKAKGTRRSGAGPTAVLGVQAKLRVNATGDRYEREADAVADAVTAGRSAPSVSRIGPGGLPGAPAQRQTAEKEDEPAQRQAAEEEEEMPMQRQAEEEEEMPMQRQAEEEEEMPMQRQAMEEDEEPMQRQAMDEEEEPAQRQELDEEDEAPMQRQDLEEEEAGAMQRQAMEEDEDAMQAKSNAGPSTSNASRASAASGASRTHAAARAMQQSGQGAPLPPRLRIQLEHGLGRDLRSVRVHTSPAAREAAATLNAKAVTRGRDVYLGPGASTSDTRLMAHEVTHVVQQGHAAPRSRTGARRSGRRPAVQRAPGAFQRQSILSDAEDRAAIRYTRRRYDLRSIFALQEVTGASTDGVAGEDTVEHVVSYQQADGSLDVDGMAGEDTLNVMVPDMHGNGDSDHAIQVVVDFYDLDVYDVAYTVRLDAGVAGRYAVDWEEGGRAIRVGPSAMTSATALRDAIQDARNEPVFVMGETPRTDHLTPAEEREATGYNRRYFQDPRSIRAIQDATGAPIDAEFGGNTAEHVAQFQNDQGITVDGKVGPETMERLVRDLVDNQDSPNAAVRLIIDFYNLNPRGGLMDIFVDPSFTASNARTIAYIPGASIIRVSGDLLETPYAHIVNTIAHEFEHVRQNLGGMADEALSEFRAEAVEITSADLPVETVDLFMDDADRALHHWKNLSDDQKRSEWARFVRVRRRVIEEYNSALATDPWSVVINHGALIVDYRLQTRP